jgi:class 3 adenylate cyclase/tetratricopeptide (TPR) repeat protein
MMDAAERLRPFIAGLVIDWLRETPSERHRVVDGTLAFVDISGFTRLTERLAGKGKIGAEEMSNLLDVTFAALLGVAYDYGAWLVKWGGDAVLLLFEGEQHAERACTAAHAMRRSLRQVGRLKTSVGEVTLRMSIGIHSGEFDFYLVGSLHRELVITGPGPTQTADMEAAASAGEIVVSRSTAAHLRARTLGDPRGDGLLLARSPGIAPNLQVRTRSLDGVDLESCLPEITRSHLLAGSTDGEHRLATIGFIEFSGVAELAAHGGPEAVADAVDFIMRSCQESAQRHHVTFWETDIGADGGKVMLVSGAPRSAGQDEDRMLAVVRDVIDAGGELALRAGINSGRVYAGEFGPPFRRTYSVKGDAVNLAARLMAKAGYGEIYASDTVVAHARTKYATDRLEPLVVKGKSRPVQAQRVREPLGADVATTRVDLPFAGREAELSTLLDALAKSRQGSGQVWELSGEAGIGKSRLVAELVARAQATTVVTLACDQYHSATPYAPFRRMMRRLIGIAENADPITAGDALIEIVALAAPSLLPWTPLVAAIVDAQVPLTPESDAVEAKFRKVYQEEQTARLLASLVPSTLLLVVEDLHLMDDASVDLLRHLGTLANDRPWLIVMTSRSHEAFDGFGTHRLELEALPDEVVDVVIKLATDEFPLPPHELAMVSRRSGGNPLFVQELLEATRRDGNVSALPDSIEGLMAVQIDRLQPHQRRILRIAAVLGARVDRQVLNELLRLEDIEIDSVQSVLTEFLEPDGDSLRFRHTLARDAAYEGLPFSRRQLLHGLAGQVIEQLAGGQRDNAADLLSLHFMQARNFERAWRYARIAGDRARDIHAPVAAAEFYERALDAAKRLETPETEIASIAESLGDARYKLGEFGHAAIAYRKARTVATNHLDCARLYYKSSLVADRAGQLGSALRWLTKAQRVLGDRPLAAPTVDHDAIRLLAECRAQYGLIRHWQGRDVAAVAALREAVLLAEKADADDALATALVWLDNCQMTLGGSGNGDDAGRALAIWRRIGNRPWEEARTLNQLGIRAYFIGRWDLAVDYYRQSKEACDRAGDQFTAAVELGNMAEVLSDQGRLDEAEPLLHDAQRVWRAAVAPSFVAFGKSQLGRLAARSGRFDEALELLQSARDDYLADGEQSELLESDARIAEALLLQGSYVASLDAADEAMTRASSNSAVLPQIPLLQRVRGLALAALGDRDEAQAALEASLVSARERHASHEIAWTLHALNALHDVHGFRSADPAMVAEQAALLEQLGIVTIAGPAMTSSSASAVSDTGS